MGITKKLLLINSLICAAFIVVIIVVFFSFHRVEKVLTTTFASETRRIVENSNMARELTRVLSDMNLVLSTFYEKKDVLKTDGERLVRGTETLLAKSGDEELKASLTHFKQQIDSILTQCEKVNQIRQAIAETEKQFDNQLISLDNLVAEKLVELMAKGEDTLDMDQLSSLIGGFRESFMRIKLQFVQLGLEHFKKHPEDTEHPLLTLSDDLRLRLRTLTAAEPAVAERGRNLIRLVESYKEIILNFHRTTEEFVALLENINREKEKLLSIMEKIDRQVEKKTEEATESLTGQIDRAMMTNLLIFIGILPIVILGGMTAYSIKKPVYKVIEYIERISKGDIPEQIEENYRGEFALVKDYLNMLISASNSVTQIAEKIAAGNMEIVVRERSENDRLMQALNSMIHSLKQFQKETDIMIQSVGTGHLDIRGNTEAFEGGWRELVSGVNNLIGRLSSAVSEKTALNMEMELAKKIQMVLLPKKPEIQGYEIAASCEPSEEVGGDYYDVISVGGFDWIVIGDVSGHGVTAGLVMMMVQTAIHTVLIQNPQVATSRLLSVINRTIYENIVRMDEQKHMTIIVIACGKDGFFDFSGLHEDILIWCAETRKVEKIETDGMWIGLEADISKMLPVSEFRLGSGDCVVLYTDGIIEARGKDGKFFGTERLTAIFEASGGKSVSDTHTAILTALKDYEKPDDVTLFVMKRV